jgi:hypothetical protein
VAASNLQRLTRRQLLLGAATAAGLTLAGSDSELTRGLARSGAATVLSALETPAVPSFVSRPDLRIPGLVVAAGSNGVAPGLIMLAPYNAPSPAQVGPLIVDNSGQPVWESPLQDLIATDLRVQAYRGVPSLTWWEGDIDLGHGIGSYVIADAAYRPVARMNAGNGLHGDLHEFLLTDRGTALLTSYVVTRRDLRAVGGSADGTIQDAIFQEVDVLTGRVLTEWHSLDHIPITESYWPVGADWDYVHLNSIAVDTDQNLLVSSRNTHTIYKLDRGSGEIIWRLGGKSGNFAIAADASFAWQHDARRQPDGSISVFDNGDSVSRALLLAVDETHRRVTLRHAYTHPSNLFADSQGNVEVLANGNVFVGWGAQPYVSEFSPAGELLFDARLGAGYISYRAYRIPWSTLGIGMPAVAARRSQSSVEVFVSWNGDTRVARWTAFGAGRSGALVGLGSAARGGFETRLPIPPAVSRVQLRGSDASGRTLTTSALTAV